MSRHEINYFFQHKMLPQLFYEETENFIKFLLGKGNTALFEMHRDLYSSKGEVIPYTEADYEILPVKPVDNMLAVIVRPPQPEEAPLCHCIIMAFDTDCKEAAFFTLEKGNSFGKRTPSAFLCGWSARGEHLNYGGYPVDLQKVLNRCLEICGIK